MQRRFCARDGGPDPRQHGLGARARHHDQGPRRHVRLHRRRRAGLHAQFDRHAGPCRLQLRGLALACGVRGRAARRRCLAGHRGTDARKHVSRDGARFGNSPRAQQDRPVRRRPQARQAGDRGHFSHPRRGCARNLRQAGHQHRRSARGHRAEPSLPAGRPEHAASGADLRQLLRRLPRRYRLHALEAGHDQARHGGQDDGHGRNVQGARVRLDAPAGSGACEAVRGRSGRLLHREHQGRARDADRRHGHGRRASRERAAAGLPQGALDGLLRHLHRGRQQVSRSSRRAGKIAAQRRELNVRAGILCRAGLRLPLRLPRHAAHGGHSGALGARI